MIRGKNSVFAVLFLLLVDVYCCVKPNFVKKYNSSGLLFSLEKWQKYSKKVMRIKIGVMVLLVLFQVILELATQENVDVIFITLNECFC